MKIEITIEVEAEYHESNDDIITLETLRFPGTNLNIHHYLTKEELAQALSTVQDTINQRIIDRANLLRENEERRGDARRGIALDMQREALAELKAQRGVR